MPDHLPDNQCCLLVLSILACALVLRSRSCGYFHSSFVLPLFSNKLIFENNYLLITSYVSKQTLYLKTLYASLSAYSFVFSN